MDVAMPITSHSLSSDPKEILAAGVLQVSWL